MGAIIAPWELGELPKKQQYLGIDLKDEWKLVVEGVVAGRCA